MLTEQHPSGQFLTSGLARVRHRRPSPKVTAYLLALVLPPLCSIIVVHVPALYAFPVALHFLVIVLVVTLAGLGPGMLAISISMLARVVQGTVLSGPPLQAAQDTFRFLVFIVSAIIISLLSRRRRVSEASLAAANAAVQERNDALIDSLGSSKCACWTLDLDSGKSARWYPGSYPVFGRPFIEIEALPSLRSLLHSDDLPAFAQLVEAMRGNTQPVVFEYRVLWPNQELHWLEMRGTRVPGRGCRWRGVTLDVTERKLAEDALLRSEKLAAMGRLASTVAHEINNPLEAVTNLLYLARSEPLPEPLGTYLATAERELARLGNITRLTLGFVRTNADISAVDVAETLDDVMSIFQHRLDARSVFVQRCYGPGLQVSMPVHELRQIVTNLIANAADAVPVEGARIAITLTQQDERVILLVQDNGCGIDPDHLARIFEPFFSTKQETGTGIGLWVTRELVEKNGGRISAESYASTGPFRTTFRIELPTATA